MHTASDIPVSAYSCGTSWQAFVGVQTNTDMFFKIARLVLGSGRGRSGQDESREEDER